MTGITTGKSRNVTLREVNKAKWITTTAIFMGMNIALCAFGVPVPGGHLYLNDVVICTAALLLDPVAAFIVGGVGAFLGDFLFYPLPMFVSLAAHGLQAAAISFLFRRIFSHHRKVAALISLFAGAVIMVTLYTLGKIYVYSTFEYAMIKLPYEIAQARLYAPVLPRRTDRLFPQNPAGFVIRRIKMELVHVQEDALEEIRQQAYQAACEVCEGAKLREGDLFVVGCSTSEVLGEKIGTHSSLDAAGALFEGIDQALRERGIFLAAQCCEHLGRALIVEREACIRYRLEEVNVIPQPKAGGSFGTTAYRKFRDPVAVESLQQTASAGIDIGGTLIGMHIRPVVVPLRISLKKIGEASIICARRRPRFVGGSRAVYNEELM